MEVYLIPTNGQKSFHKKAKVDIHTDYDILYSYDTPVLIRVRGDLADYTFRLWGGWSATTQKHIKAFCGLNKSQYINAPVYKLSDIKRMFSLT